MQNLSRITFLSFLISLTASLQSYAEGLESDPSGGLISLSQERFLGHAWLRNLRAYTPEIGDPLLQEHLELTANRIAEHTDTAKPPFGFILILNEQINAFAAPGGIIGVNAGLFIKAQRESAFASVIAHELAHLDLRHYARMLAETKRNQIPNIMKILAGVAIAATVGGDAGAAAIAAAQGSIIDKQLRFSRRNEQEADRVGIRYLAKSNYDPMGMPEMFRKMYDAYKFTRRPPDYFLTHPNTLSRVTDTLNRATQYKSSGKPDRFEYRYLRIRANLSFNKNVRQKLAQYEAINQEENFKKLETARYARALLHSQLGEHSKALPLIKSLYQANPNSHILGITYAELLIHAEYFSEAEKILEPIGIRYPNSYSYQFTRGKLYMANESFTKAIEAFREITDSRPADHLAWSALSRAYMKAKIPIKTHQARAEYLYQIGQYERAFIELGRALELTDSKNFIQIARIKERQSEIKTMLRRIEAL